VRVTRAGRQLLARLHSSRRALLDEQLSTWPDDDRARAAAILSRLAAAL
jgi:DNA-binding MarR family transcriptional regulator